LWRVVAIGSVVAVGVSSTVMAFTYLQTTTRLVAAVEQLRGVVSAMNTAAARAAPPPVCAPSAAANPPTPDWPVALGIMRLDENTFRVDRRVIDAVLEHQADLPRTPNIVPEFEKGRAVGLWLIGLRPDSLLGRLGLKDGDRVQSINGTAMSTPGDLLEAYARLSAANHLSVVLTRRGSRVRLEYYLV
jgi:general secretion pathway protein C